MGDLPADARDLLLDDLLGRWHLVLTREETALEESTDATDGWMSMDQINAQNYQPAESMPLGSYVQRMGIGDQVAGAADESVEVVLADVAARALVCFRQTMPVGNSFRSSSSGSGGGRSVWHSWVRGPVVEQRFCQPICGRSRGSVASGATRIRTPPPRYSWAPDFTLHS